MAAVGLGKRPFSRELENGDGVVDLTLLSDNDEQRPAKRHRSTSHTSTLNSSDQSFRSAQPVVSSQKSVISRLNHHNKAKPNTKSHTTIDLTGDESLSSRSGTPSDARYRHSFIKTKSDDQSAVKVKPNGLANSITNLSIRQSPRPRNRTTSSIVPAGNHLNPRSPFVVDLETDSSDAPASTNRRRASSRKSTRSVSPVFGEEEANLDLKKWLQPAVEPIRFDPSESSITASILKTDVSLPNEFSVPFRPPINGNSSSLPVRVSTPTITSVRKPVVDLPPRPVVKDISVSRTPQSQTPRAPLESRVVSNTASTQSVRKPFIIVPPTPAQESAERKKVLKAIKADVNYIKEHPKEVGAILGVAPFEDIDLDLELRKRARQQNKKKKSVNRDAVELDLGLGTLASAPVPISNTSIAEPYKVFREILTGRFRLPHSAPLSWENKITSRYLHGKFQFVSRYALSKKTLNRLDAARRQPRLNRKPWDFSRSCNCTDSCQSNCTCARVQEGVSGSVTDVVGLQPYQRRSDGLVVLSDTFLDTWIPTTSRIIFECTNEMGDDEGCHCSDTCINRVVQKGRTMPLQIFETESCGFGVRTLENIVRGQFIDLYLGEVLTMSELVKRENAAEDDTPSYVMSLDAFQSDESAVLYVDGAIFGSVTRFVNHSCEPNARTAPVVLSEGTKQCYNVAFFAIRDIPAGKEITIDYDPSLQALEGVDQDLDSAIVQCQCGSEKCRKQLWAPSKEKRKRRRVLPVKDDD